MKNLFKTICFIMLLAIIQVNLISEQFNLQILQESQFHTKTVGNGYVYDNPAAPDWFGDKIMTIGPGVWHGMRSISYLLKTDGTIVKGEDLTPERVEEYGLGAIRVQLWMGDYTDGYVGRILSGLLTVGAPIDSAWGSGAEIGY